MSKWDTLTPSERIVAVKLDCMRHPDFALIAPVMSVGKTSIVEDIPTAATDGRNIILGSALMADVNRGELRYIMLHEAMHIMLHHCTAYRHIWKKYGRLSNIAADYVVNGFIEETDPDHRFVTRPAKYPPLFDKKYLGMAFLDVLRQLVDENEQNGGGEGGGGEGKDSFDQHMQNGIPDGEETIANVRQVEEAMREGKILSDKMKRMRGDSKGGSPLDRMARKSNTNWRDALREFITSVTEGDEFSRYNPPNRRMLAHDIIFPTHFSESTGELIVASDTSGSMYGVLPVVFGEVARVAQQAKPERVRVLWWDSSVCGDEVYQPHQYEQIANCLQPAGGGGTIVSCVARYIQEVGAKPRGVIYITDGYIESEYELPNVPVLWGVIDNNDFKPSRGKVINISSL